MKKFDERLNEAFARYTETEFSADAPHEYTPENRERAEEILRKTKKETTRRFPMKKRFAAALVCALVLVSSAVVYAASPAVREYVNMLFLKEDSVGRLTEVPEGYVGVYTSEDLDNVRNDLNGKYILMNDIDLGGKNFVPIGDSGNPFTGIFNGNGYVISGLLVDGAYDYAGLFGYCRRLYAWTDELEVTEQGAVAVEQKDRLISGGIIKNLALKDGSVHTSGGYSHSKKGNIAYAGAIAGYSDYVVGCYTENFTVTAEFSEEDSVKEVITGGVVGRSYFVDSCYSSADILLIGNPAADAEEVYISGVAGYSFSCVTSYFDGTIDSGDYPDYGVTYCQEYDVPIVLSQTILDELTARLDAENETAAEPKYHTLANDKVISWNSAKLNAFYANATSFVYLDLPYQSYLTSDDTGETYYLLDPVTTSREYDELSRILALAFPNNTFREFCIENHIKSGYYACYDLRDTPDCTFDGFDFDYIWYDRESPKLRLFENSTAHTSSERASEILDRYSDYMDAAGQPVSDTYSAYEAYQNGWIKIGD